MCWSESQIDTCWADWLAACPSGKSENFANFAMPASIALLNTSPARLRRAQGCGPRQTLLGGRSPGPARGCARCRAGSTPPRSIVACIRLGPELSGRSPAEKHKQGQHAQSCEVWPTKAAVAGAQRPAAACTQPCSESEPLLVLLRRPVRTQWLGLWLCNCNTAMLSGLLATLLDAC